MSGLAPIIFLGLGTKGKMQENRCERCGNVARVTVGSVGSDRSTNSLSAGAPHQYCEDCARAVGIPIPRKKREPTDVTEPEPASWFAIEQHLAQYEQILHEQPSMREHVLSLARRLLRYSDQLSGAMPSAVADGFARLGVGKPE